MIVTYAMAKEIDYCNKGLRLFCNAHGIDYGRFKSDGLTVAELESYNDHMVDELIAYAKTKVTNG